MKFVSCPNKNQQKQMHKKNVKPVTKSANCACGYGGAKNTSFSNLWCDGRCICVKYSIIIVNDGCFYCFDASLHATLTIIGSGVHVNNLLIFVYCLLFCRFGYGKKM